MCVCDCGVRKPVRNDRLKSGKTKSCGCISRELNAAAKKPPTPAALPKRVKSASELRLLAVRNAMIRRCSNPNDSAFMCYGARGITVCDRWLSSAQAFLDDMLPKYRPGLWLERIDNSAGYFPENCEFRTPFRQACNRRNTLRFQNGVLLVTWCRHHGYKYSAAYRAYSGILASTGRLPLQVEVADKLDKA